jgi:predicted unusual protein kinase regulating ubiquinone biosynthesis (AarF/ABC1/UbiB family)
MLTISHTRIEQKVFSAELGKDWRSRFVDFETVPVAAASIGQVHRGTILVPPPPADVPAPPAPELVKVAIKLQYPGVAQSIDSDLSSLSSLLVLSRLLPKGLYLENTIKVARRELGWEVDYSREADSTQTFNKLLQRDASKRGRKSKQHEEFVVPRVFRDWCTNKILVNEWMDGVHLEEVVQMPQRVRDLVSFVAFFFSLAL